MTDAIPIASKKIAGMDRPQLQAACTKRGLDSTAETEELRQLLQDHCSQQGMIDSNSVQESMEVTVKEETGDGIRAIEGELRIKEEVVEESAKTEQIDSVVKEEEGVQVKEEENTEGRDAEDRSIKQEEVSQMDIDTKIEDTTVPVIQRKQFWESRTSSTRSTLPPGMQKRERPAEDLEADTDVKEEVDQGNSLPTPGTVRNLIGKFAGSAISPPGSPVNKRRRVEMSKSSRPSTTSAPSIPKYKKVIKIPTAGNQAAENYRVEREPYGQQISIASIVIVHFKKTRFRKSGVCGDYQPPCHSQEDQHSTHRCGISDYLVLKHSVINTYAA
ncbi:hypothetical protein BGZ67_008122 [Mortierella alpina]|nr:hypothetical protein BGZ67_008122 [Mortierella alpina]